MPNPPHRIGIIGGSGLYNIEGFKNQKWRTVKTPLGTPSDQLLTGNLAGREVAFLPRHGRGHRIMPSELNHRANIWAMKKLGVQWIISVSAVGSLQKKYKPCDIVLIEQFPIAPSNPLTTHFLAMALSGMLLSLIRSAKNCGNSFSRVPAAKKPACTMAAPT